MNAWELLTGGVLVILGVLTAEIREWLRRRERREEKLREAYAEWIALRENLLDTLGDRPEAGGWERARKLASTEVRLELLERDQSFLAMVAAVREVTARLRD